MNERDAIARLRRIATHPAARGLTDDAALLDGLVITHDGIAEGVHFLSTDPPESVGRKLVAVNLSDLAAKGAEPLAALLSLSLVGDSDWEERFLDGLEQACSDHDLALIGGDTIALPPGSPRVLGLTAIGRAGPVTPARSGANAGDRLWVIGAIGDAAAGLAELRDDPAASGPLVEAYRDPRALLAEGRILAPFANAMMDVSDGLLLDASRLAEASGLCVAIDLERMPLSPAFIESRGDSLDARLFAATGGDDYALLAAFAADFDPVLTLSLPRAPSVACIGYLAADGDPLVVTSGSKPVALPEHLGHEHRACVASPMADRV